MTRLLLCVLLGTLTACSGAPAPRLSLAQEQANAADRDARRATREGQLLRAQNSFTTALALQQSLDDTTSAATTMINLATVTHQLGDHAAALALLERILTEQTPIYPPESRLDAAYRKSVILTRLSRSGEAESALQTADELCAKNCPQRFSMEVLRARLLLQKGDAQGALSLAQNVSGERAAGKEEQANALRTVAAAEEMLSRFEEALQHYKAALGMDKALGLSARIAEDLGGMARVSGQLGRDRDAAEYQRRAFLVQESRRYTASE
jgi:tetratricopeptide (TPR) repeat protein